MRPVHAISAAWNRFFFTPTSPATIGLFRIVYGVVVFLNLLGKFPSRGIFYSDAGIVSYAAMDAYVHGPWWLNARWIPGSELGSGIYFAVLIIAAVFLTAGFFSRVSAVIVYIGLVSLSNRNVFAENAGDIVLRCDALLLIFSSAGAAYSVDRWLAVRKGKAPRELALSSVWAQRLIQLQLSYLYVSTAYLKLYGPSWRDGTAMYYALRYLELRRFDLKYLFFYLWQIKLATYGTLVAEFSAGTLIWVRKLRYGILFVAFGLHEGINLSMQFPIFQYVMMATLVTFIYPEDVEMLISKLAGKLGRGESPARGRPPGDPAGLPQ